MHIRFFTQGTAFFAVPFFYHLKTNHTISVDFLQFSY